MRKLPQLEWILGVRSLFLLPEAGPRCSSGHRQRRSLKDSFSPAVAAPWCTVAVPNTVLFRVHVWDHTTLIMCREKGGSSKWHQCSGCRSMVPYHQKWDVRGQQRKRRSSRKNTSEDFDIPNTAEIDTEREEKDHARTWLSPTSPRMASINGYMYAILILWTVTTCLFSANPFHQRRNCFTAVKVAMCQVCRRKD